VHVTGLDVIPGWAHRSPAKETPDELDRERRRYEIVGEVAPQAGEPVLRKAAPSAFWGTPLAGYLKSLDVDTIVIVGESTSGCVRATAIDGRSNRYKVLVVEECVFDRHEAAHAINLFDIDQKYGDVIGVDEVVSYLRRFANWSRVESDV
jgi:nicotinamidase-related amidase